MKKLTILALHLGYGGIERCICTLSNALKEDYEIEIISTYKLYDIPAFKLDDSIKIKYLLEEKPNREEIKHSLKNFKPITFIKEIVKAIKILNKKKKLMINEIKNCNSDVIISTRDIHNLWLSKYGKKDTLKIGWEHNYHNNNKSYINKIVRSIKGLDYFVLLTEDQKDFYQNLTKTKCVCIPNALDIYPNKYASLEEKRIVSVGRLSHEKGYDDLIKAFKIVNEYDKEWQLNIIGDGTERKKIEELIEKENLNDYIKIHGYQSKEYINKYLFKSSIYVLPSRSEAFGIVLLEAFSYGLPCIAFKRATGAKALIDDNWDGYLVDDINQMAKRIIELIKNVNRRVIMGANALKKAEKYSIDNIKNKWVELIEKQGE